MTIAGIWRSLQGQARRWLPPKGGGAHAAPQCSKARFGVALGALALTAAGSVWAEGSGTMFPLGTVSGDTGAPPGPNAITFPSGAAGTRSGQVPGEFTLEAFR